MTSSGNKCVARMDLRRYLEKKMRFQVVLLRAGGSRDTGIVLDWCFYIGLQTLRRSPAPAGFPIETCRIAPSDWGPWGGYHRCHVKDTIRQE